MLLMFNPENGSITGGGDLPVAFIARSAHEKNPEIGHLLAAAPELRDCVEAALLFFAGGPWTPEMDMRWFALTGSLICSSKSLCDFARAVLANAKP